jgi:hypothetical protein
MDPTMREVLTHLDGTLTQMSHDLGWFFTLNVGLTAVVLIAVVVVWWRQSVSQSRMHGETAKALSDITAIAQTIAAQNRDVLRRLEERGP